MYEQIARNKRRTVVYVVLFLLVWLGIGAGVGWLWAALSAPPAGASSPTAGDVATGVVAAAVLALVGIAFSLTSGARMVLAVSGAQPADPRLFRELHDLVEALAIGAGLPKPDVYVIDDPSPNAFATGTSPEHAAVTVTTGLLRTMDREELEGVLAHELSHIKNFDVRLLLVVTTLIGMAGLLASLAWRSTWIVRPRGRDAGTGYVILLAAAALLGVVALVFGPLVRLALSRRREELADVSSVELTRNPHGLIRALRALERNDRPPARFNQATAAMCIDDPVRRRGAGLRRLLDTHPPIEERIAVLEEIELGHLV